MRKGLPVLATLALLLALLAPPARANPTIQIGETYTGRDNTGPHLVTVGGIAYQAFRYFTDGTGSLSFSGFNSYNGPGTVTFNNYKTLDAGTGFQNVGPDIGATYVLSANGESINVSALLYLVFDLTTGAATGVGDLTILDTSGGALWQELMAGSGGVIPVVVSQVNLLTITDAYSVNSVASFSLAATATLPAPGGLALLGLPLLALAGLRRRATAG